MCNITLKMGQYVLPKRLNSSPLYGVEIQNNFVILLVAIRFLDGLNSVLRATLFWFVTQRVVVIFYRHFGLDPEDGSDRLSRHVGKKLPLLAA
jgi:predicted cobalt transporter CbtA